MIACDSPYPDAWAYTFVGIIDEGEAGWLFGLHLDIQMMYQMDTWARRQG
jgi:hypothetical protein